jgi:hypothetical protein
MSHHHRLLAVEDEVAGGREMPKRGANLGRLDVEL